MVLWIVSVPYDDTREKSFRRIHEDLKKQAGCECYMFKVLNLRHGTLDNLILLSDDLAKYDVQVEQATHKILSVLTDVGEVNRKDFFAEVISSGNETMPAFEYMKYFEWDESQFLVTKPLQTILKDIVTKVEKFEESIRSKQNEYMNIKQVISSLQRKSEGSLLVKPLDGIIKKEHICESEYLTTLFVVIPRGRKKEWLSAYDDDMDGVEFVVPDSSELIEQDDEYCLFSVVLIRKIALDFKNACMKRKFIVRNFTYDELKTKLSQEESGKLTEKREEMRRELTERCKVGFSECFVAMCHLKAIRTFVESVLRYGLPPRFVSVLVNLKTKHVKKVHKFFRNQFKYLIDENMESMEKKNMGFTMGLQSYGMEFHPYVLLKVSDDNQFIYHK